MAYCLMAKRSPNAAEVAFGIRQAQKTVADAKKTTKGSVQPCSMTKRLRGVKRKSVAIPCDNLPGRAYANNAPDAVIAANIA